MPKKHKYGPANEQRKKKNISAKNVSYHLLDSKALSLFEKKFITEFCECIHLILKSLKKVQWTQCKFVKNLYGILTRKFRNHRS